MSLPPPPALTRLRRISHLLDNAIPIPGVGRIGLDPIIGLLPGGGDLLTGAVSVYIVAEAARLGVPANTLGRMGWNIVLEVVAGTIPVVGDLFDATWKANAQNVRLLEQHFEAPKPSGAADRAVAIALIMVLVLVILAVASLSVLALRWILSLMT